VSALYNDNDEACAHVLRALIEDEVIAPGMVDSRSIKDLQPDDIRNFTQVHLFAGGGIWSVAAKLAGWADNRPIWTVSCPCQPFSVAGKGAGSADARHLWPDVFRLVCSCRPAVIVGEQVARKAGENWFDGVRSDLESADYACRAVSIPALAVDAPHIRQRLYWVAVANADSSRRAAGDGTVASLGQGRPTYSSSRGSYGLADAGGCGRDGRSQEPFGIAEQRAAAEWTGGGDVGDAARQRRGEGRPEHEFRSGRNATPGASFWRGAEWRVGADGKARRVGTSLCRMDHGSPRGVDGFIGSGDEVVQTIPLLTTGTVGRVQMLRILGNAIVAPLAAEVLKSLMEVLDEIDTTDP
jgi:DNA (cytosine-5)-methyltransferase 1